MYQVVDNVAVRKMSKKTLAENAGGMNTFAYFFFLYLRKAEAAERVKEVDGVDGKSRWEESMTKGCEESWCR